MDWNNSGVDVDTIQAMVSSYVDGWIEMIKIGVVSKSLKFHFALVGGLKYLSHARQ